MKSNASDELKRKAGESAAELVEDGMIIGLGTGSTVAHTIRRIGERIKSEGMRIKAVPTSYQSEMLAIESSIELTTLQQHPRLDIAIDGADQADENLNVIKGGGAAHTREKIVSFAARRFVVVVDEGKLSDKLSIPVPLEVISFASPLVEDAIKGLGGNAVLRNAIQKDGPVISDSGNIIMDADFGVIDDPAGLSHALSGIPGLVEHGIFLNVSEIHAAGKKGVSLITRNISR